MSRRLRIVTVGVLAALVVSMTFAASASAYKTGNYKGKTKQDFNFKFKAKALGVKKFKLKIVTDCDDGSQFLFEGTGAQAPTDENGRFVAGFIGNTGSITVTGRLKGKRAEGKIEATGANPDGFACTGKTRWNAKKK